jgi:hypothetical protein
MRVLIRHVDHTPFNFPVFLVTKHLLINKKWSIALLKLNAATSRLSQYRYPMMRADKATSLLSGMKCFSTLNF